MIRKALKKYRFWLILALLFLSQVMIVGGFFLSIRLDLDTAQRALLDHLLAQRAGPLMLLALLLLMAQGLALKALINRYLAPMARLAEEVILLKSNPAHRIVPEGAPEVRDLGTKLNAIASTHQQLHDDVEARIDAANRALAEEKNRLAALMSELAQSVLVCNIEGQILLYNTRARQLLEAGQSSAAAVGLGRSLFGVLERGLIVHALEQIQYQLQQPGETPTHPVAGFVTTLGTGKIVRAQMAPVLDSAQALHGFVLTLEDITRNVEFENRRDAVQQLLTQDARATLVKIRAATETMKNAPQLSEEKRQQLTAVIEEESQRLAQQIEHAEHQQADNPGSHWHLEEMRGRDLLALLQRRIDTATLPSGALDAIDDTLWLKVDSYALTAALAHLAHHLLHEQEVTELRLGLTWANRLAHLELFWNGAMLSVEMLRAWEAEPLQLEAGKEAVTLGSVVSGRAGDAVYRFDPSHGMSCYRVLLPVAEPRAPLEVAVRQPGRPEFYDFDLFHQSGQNAALDERPLTQLTYTVFDTETTGLHPAGGDEIISIGALRIVNNRLLVHESFDQLVQPGMLLSAESTAIHGIDNAMLKGRPGIEKVLPQFHRFAEDTVLVAHNAAFDMRFLQMKEEKTGIRFTQPVLDTLLLSQVIHPNQKDHSLEAIAQRFGVDIVGRHTALGDTLVTGEVFLKMIPLLAEKGIFTLKQAREAEQLTPYARIRY
ncbi:MAG TPA: exonuclease domain-containing protein [Noviherbaspirillum sp.]|nr:exonuclease domain-containing protein [Noviherbaspirillum sp.]